MIYPPPDPFFHVRGLSSGVRIELQLLGLYAVFLENHAILAAFIRNEQELSGDKRKRKKAAI